MAARVLITGLGAVSALGHGVSALSAGLRDGTSGIGALTRFAYEGRCGRAAEVRGEPDVPVGLPVATVRRLSRPDRLALAAAAEACEDAGLAEFGANAALFVGATTGGMHETAEAYRRWRAGETSRLRLSRVLGTSLASSGAAIAQALGIHGPQETVSTACSSSAMAVARAIQEIRRGTVGVALAVGTDGLSELTYAGFDALQALDPEGCRPFDRTRRGLTLGEGAGALVVESEEHAHARGARARATLLGWAASSDAHHPTAPHPEGVGATAALVGALADAGVPADAVDYVNAHGTGTPQNDAVEIDVLRRVLGTRLAHAPVSSTKSQIGHTLGAAGAIETVVTALALETGVLPPTLGLRDPDERWADVDFVTTPGRHAALGIAITSSYGFGGHNVTLVLGNPERE